MPNLERDFLDMTTDDVSIDLPATSKLYSSLPS